jgi:hypothetical protein
MENEMDEQEAIDYLEEKKEIKGKKTFTPAEKKKIKEVMKSGKIYGDPHCEITY